MGSIVYVLGVAVGLVFLIVPGLIALARWSLLAPFVVLEEAGVGEALRRSSEVVRAHFGRVLAIVLVTFLVLDVPAELIFYFVLGRGRTGRSSRSSGIPWRRRSTRTC